MRAVLPFLPWVLACSAADTGLEGTTDAETDDAAMIDGAITDARSTDASVGDSSGPCPASMALVVTDAGRVCVDLFEGAVASADGSLWPHEKPIDGADAAGLHAVVADHVVPQGYISQEQATDVCRTSGKRLCTLEEWTAACRGQPTYDYLYPYGDTYQAGACNEGHESPILILFGPNPTYSNAELNDPRCDELEGGVAPGGQYSKCVSFYGAFDMHGNLHEWIDDSPGGDPTKGSFMGGYFVDAKINGAGCTYRTTAHAKTYHDYSTGFRCCADAKGP